MIIILDNGQRVTQVAVNAIEKPTSITLPELPFDFRQRIHELKGKLLHVYMAHLCHANHYSKEAWPLMNTLNLETGYSDKHIRVARGELSELGWMRVYRTYDPERDMKETASTCYCKFPAPVPGTFYWREQEKKKKVTQ
jgi:hypothetical protein